MLFKTTATELRKALADLERAEKNGFMFCEAVFNVQEENSYWELGTYSDMIEKAYPTGGHFNWGRGQDVTKNNIFKDGKVIPTKERQEEMDNFPESLAVASGKIGTHRYWICNPPTGGIGGCCGYISFAKRPVIEKEYHGIMTYVPVHGGITYAEEGKFGMVYGFDTAHCDSEKFPRNDHEWIKKQIRKMLEGILVAQKVEKKYLFAKTEEEKAKYAQMVLDTDTEKENGKSFGVMMNILSGNL